MNKVLKISKALLFMSAAVPASAWAQTAEPAPAAQPTAEDDGALHDIVVTAQRREESLQKVPIAITAISSENLEAKGITGLGKLTTSVVPGVIVTSFAGSPGTLGFNIRGASAADPGIGLAEQGVAIYADGVPLGRAVGLGIDLADLERIEVLRGPQGTLFGRNAEGGAVQFVTRRPSGVLGGRIEGEIGNYNQRRLVAFLDLPAIGNVSIKLSGLIDRHDGYVKNLPLRSFDAMTPGNQNDFGFKDQRGFRAAALWSPSTSFNAYYAFDYSDLRFTNTYTYRTGGPTPAELAFCRVPAFAATCATPASIAANVYQNTRRADTNLLPEYSSLPYFLPKGTNKIRGHTLILTYQASDTVQFKSITGYRRLTEDSGGNLGDAVAFVQVVPSSFFPLLPAGTTAAFSSTIPKADIDQKQFSEELQMTADLADFKFTAGLFYYYEKVNDTRDTMFNTAFVTNGTALLTPVAINPISLSPSRQTFVGVAHSYAAYAQATYAPSALFDGRLSFTGGLRYTDDKKEFTRTLFASAPDNTRAPTFKASRFDPAATIAFQATPSLNAYARWARAYRAGGLGIRNKLALSPYDSEENTTWEAGFKSQMFDNHVRFNVAAYSSRIKGYQLTVQNSVSDPSSTITLNLGSPLRVKGIESELVWAVTRALSLGASYGYMEAKGPATVTTLVGALEFTPPSVPKHSVSITADFNQPVFDETKLSLHVDYNYLSDFVNSPLDQGAAALEPKLGLSQFNTRFGFRDIPLGAIKVDIMGYVNNVFDRRDLAFSFALGTSDFTKAANPGGNAYIRPPRTYGLQVRAAF